MDRLESRWTSGAVAIVRSSLGVVCWIIENVVWSTNSTRDLLGLLEGLAGAISPNGTVTCILRNSSCVLSDPARAQFVHLVRSIPSLTKVQLVIHMHGCSCILSGWNGDRSPFPWNNDDDANRARGGRGTLNTLDMLRPWSETNCHLFQSGGRRSQRRPV